MAGMRGPDIHHKLCSCRQVVPQDRKREQRSQLPTRISEASRDEVTTKQGKCHELS